MGGQRDRRGMREMETHMPKRREGTQDRTGWGRGDENVRQRAINGEKLMGHGRGVQGRHCHRNPQGVDHR